MVVPNAIVADESLDEITDALLTASRLLVAISARSIAAVDDTVIMPQFRMPPRERRGLVTALTAFTAAGDEPALHPDGEWA